MLSVPCPVSAQEPADAVVQAPRLLNQVAPRYPQSAPAGAHGDVSVRVTVNAQGQVVGAQALSGPEVFYAAAEAAALQLRWEPGSRQGQPVQTDTLVRFHFAPPEAGVPAGLSSADMVVEGEHPTHDDTRARTTLDATDIERSAGQDLATTVEAVPGVTAGGGTANQSKPIIRGQTERRLLLLQDGVRHESQKWGPDHAPEIDPSAAGEISVIKGAAGVRYGPDAIGGVVLVEPPPMRSAAGVGGRALVSGASNGQQGFGALRVDVVPAQAEALSFRVQGSYGRGASLQTPDYILGNTGSEQLNLGASVQLREGLRSLRASWQRYDLRAGIFYDVASDSPSGFAARLQRDRPLTADLWSVTYDIERPRQEVVHDRVTLHATSELGDDATVELIYAYQINQRQEFESVRETITGPQYDFKLRTHSLDGTIHHDHATSEHARLTGTAGVQAGFQENVYAGYALLPNYRAFSGGLFATERLRLGPVDLEGGARHDRLFRAAWLDELDYARHLDRGTLGPDVCEQGEFRTRCPADYGATSLTLGALWRAVPEALEVKLDLSSASRMPNADELYLIGSAPSFPVFGLGSPDLDVETTWGSSLTAGLDLPWIAAEVSGFANLTTDYIYLAPEIGPSGSPTFEVTIAGTWPRFTYRPVNARFVGGDGFVSVGPRSPVGLDLSAAVVRASELGADTVLVGTPADRARARVVARPSGPRWMEDAEVEVFVDRIAVQTRTDPREEFATPPEGATLLGAGASAAFPLREGALRVGLTGHNLLNTAWRDYSSLLRFYAHQPGRDVRLRVGLDF